MKLYVYIQVLIKKKKRQDDGIFFSLLSRGSGLSFLYIACSYFYTRKYSGKSFFIDSVSLVFSFWFRIFCI